MSANGHNGFSNGTQDGDSDAEWIELSGVRESTTHTELVPRNGSNGQMHGGSNGVANGSHNGTEDNAGRTSDFITTPVSQERATSIRVALLSGEQSIKDKTRLVTGSSVAEKIWTAWVDDHFASVARLIGQSEDYRSLERPFECLTASEVYGSDYRLFDLVLTQDPAKRTVYYIKVQESGEVDLCTSSNSGVSTPPAPASPALRSPSPPRAPRVDMS